MTKVPSERFECINEDTIECLFFLTHNCDYITLDKLSEEINSNIKTQTLGYIWHKEEFKVYTPINQGQIQDVPTHLISTTCFGDNIEDEWFIVHLVLEITKLYKNLIVQVKDSDGEFLLIEAADYLSSWANPDTTENRVFIYNNKIHIIPPTIVDLNSKLKLKDAISIVIQQSEQTEASPTIQQAITRRIGNYPGKIKDNIHKAIVKLPVHIATLLTLKPSLISSIVTAYCSHDMIDAKLCRNVDLIDCVTVEVKFTKCLYAMLMHSKLIKCLANANNLEKDKKSTVGLKLTCGYQIIMSSLTKDIFSSKKYNKYIHNLKENGYFKDNIEGSRDYNELLGKAKSYFSITECPFYTHAYNTISKVMSTEEFLKLKELKKNKQLSPLDLNEDNEDWLNIHPEQLNDLLNKRYSKQVKFSNGSVITAETITSELSSFLKKTSDFEGIETSETQDPDNSKIEFDVDEFMDSVNKILSLVTNENNGNVDDLSDIDEDMQDDMSDLSDKEIKANLHTILHENLQDSKSVLSNIVQSMKEEEGSLGPSSNLLKGIGINKNDLLDSDDDEI